jgi:hypothetical protein
MQDARRLRAQAEQCLQIAHLISDGAAVAELHANAADHLAHARDIERQSETARKIVIFESESQ